VNGWSDVLRTFGIIAVELLALFLVVSFAVALINRRLGGDRIQSWLAGGSVVGPLKGAALGSVTPFCSCSTIPMLVGMLKAGVPFGTAAAFLIGSPLLNPFIVGAIGLLFGWKIAAGYALVAFAGTLLIAAAWDRLGLARHLKRVRVEGGSTRDEPWAGLRAEAAPAWAQARADFRPLLLPLVIGVSVGALIYGAVPQSLLADVAGPGNPLAVPVAAVLGIPLYVRAEAALPIGLALTTAGVGVGPVFALIIGGAGASIPEASMLAALFKPALLAAFVGSVLTIAVTGGLIIPLFA
jgi:uncharacterized membrane protein YraQ (UPF0718 family)